MASRQPYDPHRPPAASLSTNSRAPRSAFLPTPVQHVCRPTSAPLLNRFYSSLFLSLLSSSYLWDTLAAPSLCPIEARRPASGRPSGIPST